tara:strand:+ start:242 stop:631 length:390 start_codon:yes stop_codon:yes gene_type:complete
MEFDKFNPDFHKNIGFRHIEVEEKYNLYKSNSKFLKTRIKDKLFSQYQPYNIIKNLYPYNWKNAIHYIMWINPKYDNFYDNKRIVDILNIKFKGKNIKIWENEYINRSIPSIKHFHLILKISSELLVHH